MPADLWSLCVLLACRSPRILHRVEGDRYQRVGECHIEGLMFCEALFWLTTNQFQPCMEIQ